MSNSAEEDENTWLQECEWDSESEEYGAYSPILRKVQEMLDEPAQLAKNANFRGLHGEAAYRIIGPMCVAALNPACTYLAAQTIRNYIRDGGCACANETADWLKEYIPPKAVLRTLKDGMSAWHRHVQNVMEQTRLMRYIYIP
eukprot:6212584-Pleurochrysis_carterae.AAC.1